MTLEHIKTFHVEPMKTVEELMIPRCKVLVNYPGSSFTVGEVLTRNPMMYPTSTEVYSNSDSKEDSGCITHIWRYPAIFKSLKWWEDRNPDDFPEYVKINEFGVGDCGQGVFKWIGPLQESKWGLTSYGEGWPLNIEWLNPATEEEYTNYQQSNQ